MLTCQFLQFTCRYCQKLRIALLRSINVNVCLRNSHCSITAMRQVARGQNLNFRSHQLLHGLSQEVAQEETNKLQEETVTSPWFSNLLPLMKVPHYVWHPK